MIVHYSRLVFHSLLQIEWYTVTETCGSGDKYTAESESLASAVSALLPLPPATTVKTKQTRLTQRECIPCTAQTLVTPYSFQNSFVVLPFFFFYLSTSSRYLVTKDQEPSCPFLNASFSLFVLQNIIMLLLPFVQLGLRRVHTMKYFITFQMYLHCSFS